MSDFQERIIGLVTCLVLVVIFLLLLMSSGCQLFTSEAVALNTLPVAEKAEAIITITEMKARLKAAHYTDWLMGLFLLGSATGIYTIIRGQPREGWAVAGAGVGGMYLTLYVQRAYEIPLIWLFGGLVVVVGVIAFLYRDRIGKSAFKTLAKDEAILSNAEEKLIKKARKT